MAEAREAGPLWLGASRDVPVFPVRGFLPTAPQTSLLAPRLSRQHCSERACAGLSRARSRPFGAVPRGGTEGQVVIQVLLGGATLFPTAAEPFFTPPHSGQKPGLLLSPLQSPARLPLWVGGSGGAEEARGAEPVPEGRLTWLQWALGECFLGCRHREQLSRTTSFNPAHHRAGSLDWAAHSRPTSSAARSSLRSWSDSPQCLLPKVLCPF